jgi:uncharacterized membrane protein YoaK (UPF0700 family)
MPPEPLPRAALFIGPALAFTAGFADASTFVGAGGIFCAHVTGNFVVLAADLALHAEQSEWLKLATFPIFVGTVLVTTWLHRRLAARARQPPARWLLAGKSALFGLAAALACVIPTSGPGPGRAAVVAMLVTAMAIQNTIHRLNPGFGPFTTVMTGNVTGWVVDVLAAAPRATPDAVLRRRQLGLVIAAFALGCAAGGLGVVRFGFVALLVPMVVTLLARSRVDAARAS